MAWPGMVSVKCLFCMHFEGGAQKITDRLDRSGGLRDSEESRRVLRFWACANKRMKVTLTKMGRTAVGQAGEKVQELDTGHVCFEMAVRYLSVDTKEAGGDLILKFRTEIWAEDIHLGCQCLNPVLGQGTGWVKMSEETAARHIQHGQGQRDEEKTAKEAEQEQPSFKQH